LVSKLLQLAQINRLPFSGGSAITSVVSELHQCFLDLPKGKV